MNKRALSNYLKYRHLYYKSVKEYKIGCLRHIGFHKAMRIIDKVWRTTGLLQNMHIENEIESILIDIPSSAINTILNNVKR